MRAVKSEGWSQNPRFGTDFCLKMGLGMVGIGIMITKNCE